MRPSRILVRLGLPVAAALAAASFALPAAGASPTAASVGRSPSASAVEQAWADMASLHQASALSLEHAAPVVAPAQASATPTAAPAPTVRPATLTASAASADPSAAEGYGCGDALAYLRSHSAPGFVFECPGYALGHQAMTCMNVAGVCAGEHLVAIAVPCRAAYMNEASNSWVLTGQSHRPIDPYGYCPS